MRLIEGIATVGGERFADVGAFVAALGRIGDEHNVTVQAFDARCVVSRRHLDRAVEIADRERDRGDGIARDRAVEIALYAAGRRQIDRALEMGVSTGETPVVVLVDGPGDERSAGEAVRELLAPATTLGEYDERRVREFYDIGGVELDATDADLEALVLERVVLLVIDR
ncbi:MAG: KEOPS complex subunit Cgi121 [Halobacteriota archaeon]|uniref:KEOPS complex subunit Cgi121 n=1 Tax=Natronomonas sp. TaxID=2184060 RepID=UPI003974D404